MFGATKLYFERHTFVAARVPCDLFGESFAGNLGEFAMHMGEFGEFTNENLLVI